MKNLLLFLFFASAWGMSGAQTYFPLVEPNKEWSIAHTYGHPFPMLSDHIRFGDEIEINGLNYRQTWRCTGPLPSAWTEYGFIREDSLRRVYYLSWSGGPPNNLLYDFSADAGDTVSLFYDPMGWYFVVDSAGQYPLLNGETRRSIMLTGYSPDGIPFCHDTWVEGMGSLYGVLQSGSCLLVGDDPELMCFRENDTLKFFNTGFTSCDVISETGEISGRKKILEVFTGPSGDLTVRLTDAKRLPLCVRLTDITGRKVFQVTQRHLSETYTCQPIFAGSLLIYHVSGAGGFMEIGKIVCLPN